jgi:hypothetical protein
MIICESSQSRRKYKLPESFNELTRKQLVRIAGLQLSDKHIDVAMIEIMRVLLNMSHLRYTLLRPEIKERLLTYCTWVISENTCTAQLIPSYRRWCSPHKFYGPDSELDNLKMAEFHACEVSYRKFLEGRDGALDELISILYRPAKPRYDHRKNIDGDVREKYNGNTVKYRTRIVARWPADIKQAILLFYDGCRMKFIKDHPIVFAPAKEDETEDDQFHGMFMMIRGLAADGKYGTVNDVEDLYVVTALNEVTQLLIEQQKLIEKTEE